MVRILQFRLTSSDEAKIELLLKKGIFFTKSELIRAALKKIFDEHKEVINDD